MRKKNFIVENEFTTQVSTLRVSFLFGTLPPPWDSTTALNFGRKRSIFLTMHSRRFSSTVKREDKVRFEPVPFVSLDCFYFFDLNRKEAGSNLNRIKAALFKNVGTHCIMGTANIRIKETQYSYPSLLAFS